MQNYSQYNNLYKYIFFTNWAKGYVAILVLTMQRCNNNLEKKSSFVLLR